MAKKSFAERMKESFDQQGSLDRTKELMGQVTKLPVKGDNSKSDQKSSDPTPPKPSAEVTDRPSDRVTDRPTDTDGDRPGDRVTDGQGDRPGNIVTDRKVDRVADRPSDRLDDQLTDRQADRVTEEYSDRPIDRLTDRPNNYTSEEIIWKKRGGADNFISRKPENLTLRQFEILRFIYFNRPFKIESQNGLGEIMKMGPNNAKNQVKSLVSKGYIYKPYSINDGINKGSTCRVIEDKCFPIFGPTSIPNPPQFKNTYPLSPSYGDSDRLTDRPTNLLTDRYSDRLTERETDRARNRQGDQLTDRESALISSSSLNKNTTTKAEDCDLLDRAIQTDPDLIYWRNRGLSCRQVKKWMDEFQILENTMLQSLRHAAFDLPQKPEVKKPEAYFRKVLTEAQNYPPPAGFKTHMERQIEQERAILERERQLAKELQEIRQEREELEFQNWLDTKGEGFEWCEKNLSSIAKRHKGKKTPVYISNMKSLRQEWIEKQKEQDTD